jgi:DNA-binding NarL/FixJ family response regulator
MPDLIDDIIHRLQNLQGNLTAREVTLDPTAGEDLDEIELQYLQALAQGHKVKELPEIIFRGTQSVTHIRERVLDKLCAKTTNQAIFIATKRGILQ